MISVITPVFNAADHLPAAAKSIQNQAYTDFEWILIDDGSTDASPDICNEITQTMPCATVLHIPHSGVSAARNAGMAQAKGEWLCFFDADDELFPDWLQNYHDAITDDVDIIFQGAKTIDPGLIRYYKLEDKVYDRQDYHLLVARWQKDLVHIGTAWSKMIRSALVKKYSIRYNETITHFEDWVFLTEILVYTDKLKTISSVGYIYNHTNSILTRQPFNPEEKKNQALLRFSAAERLKVTLPQCYEGLLRRITLLSIGCIKCIYKKTNSLSYRKHFYHELKVIDLRSSNLPVADALVCFLYVHFSFFFIDNILRFLFRIKSFLSYVSQK